MSFPGGNLLALANKAIAAQTLSYRPFIKRDLNAAGDYVSFYAAPTQLRGNIQPVPRNRYEQNGLDFQKNYVNIIIQKNVTDLSRDMAGDNFWYSGRLFIAESRTNWFAQDGWESILCIEIPGYTPPFPAEETCCNA